MSKKDKALEKLRESPKSIRFEEIDTILLRLGFEKRQRGTSHAVYTLKGKGRIVIPFRQPFILAVYVKEVIKLIDELDDNAD
jgi:predicted RNA binding protein YcfA (HicA-like mRNA interferase family)